jgi:autotransporter-associated beta strand protein
VLNNNGTLSFTGTSPATTDRQFTMLGLGANLDASCATGAPVTFSNVGPIANSGTSAVAASLTLSGSNADANVFAGQIVDPPSGQQTSLNKTGAGAWVVSNPGHTYTGPTSVSGGTLRVTGSITSSNSVNVNDTSATFEAAATQRLKALTVNAGQARVTSAPGGAKTVLTVGDPSFGGNTLSVFGGVLDLTTNGLVIDYADTDPNGDAALLASVRSQVMAGYGPNGDWKGTNGITSSSINSLTGVGYALASDVLPFANGATTDTFMGATVDKSSVLARYTLSGDLNLDGAVDFFDLARLAPSYNVTDGSRNWSTGDLNYDGNTDFLDLARMAQNYNTALLPSALIPGASAIFEADLARAFASVPEPSTTALAFIAACGLAAQCRRRRCSSRTRATVLRQRRCTR